MSEYLSDVKAVFCCQWSDDCHLIIDKLFGKKYNFPTISLTFLKKSNYYFDDNDKNEEIKICVYYYKYDDGIVGFWYPKSNYVNFEKCEEFLKTQLPKTLNYSELLSDKVNEYLKPFSTDNVDVVLTDIRNINRINTESKSSIISFVDCGHKYFMKLIVARCNDTFKYENHSGYDQWKSSKSLTYTISHNNVRTSLNLHKIVVNDENYIFWYVPSMVGYIDQAKNTIHTTNPDIPMYDISEFKAYIQTKVL